MTSQEMIREDGSVILLVHFVFLKTAGTLDSKGQSLPGNRQTWAIACVSQLQDFAGSMYREHPWQRSDDVRAVSCLNCKATEAYRRAQQALVRAIGKTKAGV